MHCRLKSVVNVGDVAGTEVSVFMSSVALLGTVASQFSSRAGTNAGRVPVTEASAPCHEGFCEVVGTRSTVPRARATSDTTTTSCAEVEGQIDQATCDTKTLARATVRVRLRQRVRGSRRHRAAVNISANVWPKCCSVSCRAQGLRCVISMLSARAA